MAELVAVRSGLALFRSGEVGVIIDTQDLNPYDPQPFSSLIAAGDWDTDADDNSVAPVCHELAAVALEGFETDIALSASANDSRVVRVPKKVQTAVRVGLEALHNDEASTVPLVAAATAEKLISGSVSIEQVRRIFARFNDASPASQPIKMIYGGDAGREWAAKVCGVATGVVAAAPVPPQDAPVDVMPPPGDEDWTDPNQPHEFLVVEEGAPDCALCGRPEADPIHVPANPESADDAPEDDGNDDAGVTYFASFAPGGDMGPTFKVDQLLALDQDGGWWLREYGEWSPTQAPDDGADIVQLDLESFNAASAQLDEPGTAYAELSISEERLFELAEPHLDYARLDALFAAVPYVPPEVRSANAKKQLRDTKGHFIEAGGTVQDANGDRGTIVGIDHATGSVQVKIADGTTKTVPANEVTVDRNAVVDKAPQAEAPATDAGGTAPPAAPAQPVIARLPHAGTLIPDVHSLIDNYVQSAKAQQGGAADPVVAAVDPLIPPATPAPVNPTPTDSGPPLDETAAAAEAAGDPVANSPVPPLYLAEVDPQDTSAVLSCLAVIPATSEGANIEVYKRVSDGWQLDDADRQLIQGPTPPALVQLTPDMLTNVENQIGEGGSADGDASSAPAPAPVAAAGYAALQRFTIDETGLTASQTQGARLLQAYGGPDTWPVDIVDRLGEFVGGVEASPGDVKSTERLREYWTHGEGAAKIRWGEPNDWYRCVDHLSKYMGTRAKGYCTLRHHDALGKWPGQEDPGHGHGGVRAAGALVGEVQDPTTYDDAAEPAPNDMDLPHPFNPVDDGTCDTCGRDIDHILHVVVINVPGPGDEPDADDAETSPVYDPEAAEDDRDPFDGDPDEEPDFSSAHPFIPASGDSAAAPDDECECGRTLDDRMHLVGVSSQFALLADAAQTITPGQQFRIPLVVPEGVESGDGRTFAQNSLSSRPMPLALMWQPEGDEGHNGSVIVGRIDHVEKTDQGLGNAYGVFDTGPNGQEALRLVRAGMLRGISADLDEFSAKVLGGGEDENQVTATKLMVTSGRLMGITLVAKPAYAECTIELVDGEGDTDVADGQYSQDNGEARVAALIASAAPLAPPAEWFENPKLTKPTHLTIDDEGRVFGHIAAWDVDHIGLPFGTRAPRSVSNYAYFRTGSIKTAENKVVKVGQLTLTGGHAPLSANAALAVKHYDDTASAVADLAAGEDRFGIWVSGALRPGVTAEQVRALRASSPSGDWRPIRGALELVAVCQVNVPGFPVAEVMVAGGQVTALVAAGVMTLESSLKEAPKADIDARIAALEAAEQKRLDAQARLIRDRVTPVIEERRNALTAAAQAAKERIDAVRNERREALVAAAEALKNRAHPERVALLERKAELAARVAAGGLEVVPFEEDKHPRDHKGRFREVLARLENLLKGDPAAKAGVQHVEDAAAKEAAGDHAGAAAAAHMGADQLEKAAVKAVGTSKSNLDKAAKEVRQAAGDHEAHHGTGKHGGDDILLDALPAPVRELLDEAVTRAEEKLDPANPAELFAKVKAFLTGTNPMSARQVYLFIKNQLKREVTPHPTPTVSGPSPTNPGGGGVSGPGVGNGPAPS